MNKKPLLLSLALLSLLVVSLACGFSASTANIKDAYLSLDNEGAEKTTVFTQQDVFYCIVTLANAPDDTTVKAVWYAVEAQDTAPNFKIDEASITHGDGALTFDLTNNGLWPTGKYKVELYLNDKLDQTLEFQVQ
jgi:hypothetical protein